MKAWARHDALQHTAAVCRFCHEPIVLVPDVGWIVDELGGSYDMCDGNALGNHLPSTSPTTPRAGTATRP